MSQSRKRDRGLTRQPLIRTRVETVHTWYPEDGTTVVYKESGTAGPWTIASPNASVMYDNFSTDGPNARGDYTMARSCSHVRVESASLHSANVPFIVPPYQGWAQFDIRGYAPLGDLGIGGLDDDRFCPMPPTANINSFAIQSMEEMLMSFPPEQDFLSFVLELKSLTGAIDTLFDCLKQLRDLSFHDRFNIRRAAKIHAGYNFGVSPILDDTATLYNTFRRVRKRIEWLMNTRNKWVLVGSHSTYSVQENTHLEGFGYAGWTPGVSMTRISQRGTLTSTARVKQDMPSLGWWLMFVRGVIGDMGFNKPLTSFWEQTPFSWAVDYFVPVGQFLKTIQHTPESNWTVRDPSWSHKTYYDFRFPVGYSGLKLGSLGNMTLKAYRRFVGLPPWEWTIESPSPKQLSLLAAVAMAEK